LKNFRSSLSLLLAIFFTSTVLINAVGLSEGEDQPHGTPAQTTPAAPLVPIPPTNGPKSPCDRWYASILRFPVAAAGIGVALAALGVQDYKKRNELDAMHELSAMKDKIFRIEWGNGYTNIGAVQKAYSTTNSSGGWATNPANLAVAELVSEIKAQAPKERERKIALFLNEAKKIIRADGLLTKLPSFLPLLDEEAQFRILSEQALAPGAMEDWIKPLADLFDASKNKEATKIKIHSTLDLLMKEAWAATGRDRTLVLSRCLDLVNNSAVVRDLFPPDKINKLLSEYNKSTDPEERAAILAIIDRLPKAEEAFHKLIAEDSRRPDTDPLQQREFALKVIQGRLARRANVLESETNLALQGMKDASPAVRALSATMLPNLPPKEALSALTASLTALDASQYTASNKDFVNTLRDFIDLMDKAPGEVDYKKARAIAAKFPENSEYQSFYITLPNGSYTPAQPRYLYKEFTQALRINPVISKLESTQEADRADGIKSLGELALAYINLDLSPEKEKKIREVLQKSPAVRKQYLEQFGKAPSSNINKTLLVGLAEDELKKTSDNSDRSAASAMKNLGNSYIYKTDPLYGRTLALARPALKDRDPTVRSSAALILGKLEDSASLPTLIESLAKLGKANTSTEDNELQALVLSIEKIVTAHPDDVDKDELKAAVQTLPTTKVSIQQSEIQSAYFNLFKRAGLPEPSYH
jgi:hypothetical protein